MTSSKNDEFAMLALDFCDQVNRLKRAASIEALTIGTVRRLGFDHVTCAVVPPAGRSPLDHILINNRPAEYLRRYDERGYAQRDPVVTELKRSLLPFSWSEVRSRRRLSREQLNIMGEARDFGATDGLIIPIVSASGNISIFAPCGRQPVLIPRARSAVEMIGIAAHQAIQRATATKTPYAADQLSPREREILQWMAAGKTMDEIGDILAISSTTVRTHIENAKRKMNTTRTIATVVEAVRRGEILL